MREDFNFLGFKINTRKFLMTVAVYAAIIIVLMILDMFVLDISWYGFLMGSAFLLAVVMATDLMKERDIDSEFPYDLIWWVFPLSIVGARIAFVVNNLDLYSNFWEMCQVWNGGLSIYGGVMGGAVGLVICCLLKHKNILSAMDCVAPVLILGQAIGRWGNFINKEVYGWEITNEALQWFPFGVKIGSKWHLANFFYESVLDLLGFFILLLVLRKSKQKGIVACTYLAYYGFIRYFLEQLRDPKFIMVVPGTTIEWSALTSIIMFSIGAIGLITIFIINLVKNRKNTQ
ncbi:MAG: prolipoprotein diacylglyceryl transferase [Clostridia bacterium]|nr:prolipoprotein diacylglyceryl transferase [Clostridia bacterium]